MHAGVDLAAPTGTPVFAVEAGVVQRIDTNLDKPNGLAVFVRGLSGRLWCYLHLSEILATVGQPVLAGTQLGRVGSTGRTLLADGTVVSSSTGPHLHLQVYEVGGATVDPTTLVVL